MIIASTWLRATCLDVKLDGKLDGFRRYAATGSFPEGCIHWAPSSLVAETLTGTLFQACDGHVGGNLSDTHGPGIR